MLALILLAAFAVLGLPTETRAHSQTTDGYSRITVREDVIRYHLSLDFDELRRVTSLDVPPVATTAEREAALLRDRSGILAYLEPRLVLRMDEVSCQGVVAQTRVENISGQVYAGIVLDFTCPGGAAGRLQVRYGVFFDDQDPQHRNIATYRLPGHNGRFIFARDARELTVGEGTAAGSVRRFIVLGFEHILAGYDHVLFVLALLLGARGLRGVLTVATMFTLAHSATLALAVLGWASVPGAVVEPLIALSIAYTAVAESVTIVGAVFADKDADGVRDRNENGIANVSVSDGATIVQTDDSGRYSLPFNPERRRTDLVWVTVPSGYDVPTNANRTPQFYRELRSLVAGEERRQDFALQRSKQTARENFSFTALADVHVRPDPTYTNNGARFAAQLQQVNQVTGSPSFTVIAGDLLLDARDAEFEEYLAAQSTSKLPVYTAVGNHDIAFYAGPDYRDRIDPYRRYLGPEWYSFDYGQRHFVMLEDWLGFAEQPEQLEWLRQDLRLNARDDREVVVVTHVQLNAPDTREVRTAEYIKLLEEFNTKLVLMGHTHVNDVANDVIAGAQNVNTNSSGSNDNDFTPPGYRHVQFKDGRVSYPYKMFGVHRSLTLVNPAPGTEVSQARGELQVNAYNTASQVEGVQYSIDGAAERKLQQTSAFTWADPRWDVRNLSQGAHTIRVRATDDAGRTWQESATFRVGHADAVARPIKGADWPQFHGNARHTGRALDALAPQLRLAWSHRSPGSIMTSSPAIKDGAVYIGVRDEDGVSKNGLLAVDLATGQRHWRFTTQSQVQTSPAVQDGVVFAAEVRGTLYGIDARTGQELWRRVTAVEADGVQRGRMYTPPAVANGVVYQGYSTRAGTRLMALDGRTGRELWNVALENDQFVAATPIIEEGRLYVLGGSRYMIALDAATGQQIWRQRPTLSNWSHSVSSFANGRISTAFRTGVVVAMDARDGSTFWTYQDPESASYSAVHKG